MLTALNFTHIKFCALQSIEMFADYHIPLTVSPNSLQSKDGCNYIHWRWTVGGSVLEENKAYLSNGFINGFIAFFIVHPCW